MSQWEHYLNETLQSDTRHYVWLRALSYLEYIGYRKMVKALPYQKVEQGVFHHLSDEIEHSFLLKQQAESSFPQQKLSIEEIEELIDISEQYFQTLDLFIKNLVSQKLGKEHPYLCYLWVSYTIEKRAMSVYPQYYSKLTQSPLKVVLQKIIKDESEHLKYLEEIIQNHSSLFKADSETLDFEQKIFDSFLASMNSLAQKIEVNSTKTTEAVN